MQPIAMTIAGSDPSGGAGLQADLKTFHQFGVFGTSVVTLLTVQNTQAVSGLRMLPPEFVAEQFDAVASDFSLAGMKTGALGSAEIIETVAACVKTRSCPLIVDPVMISKHGHPLMDPDAQAALREELIPGSDVVTPNRYEAEALTGSKISDRASLRSTAEQIREMGARNVLIKGGEIGGLRLDMLVTETDCLVFESPNVASTSTHGSGCVLSAAVTACLAVGSELPDAVRIAKDFVSRGIAAAVPMGHGQGPINLHVYSGL